MPLENFQSMKTESEKFELSSELIAAFLDGNVSESEANEVLSAIACDGQLQDLMSISMAVDEDLGVLDIRDGVLPLEAVAANSNDGNLCSIKCERFILEQRNIQIDEFDMIQISQENKWIKEKGTPMHNIGRHLEKAGLAVIRKYNSTLEDIVRYLEQGAGIIAAVDCGELILPLHDNCVAAAAVCSYEQHEDTYIGEIPDHSVVIKSYNKEENSFEIYNPDSGTDSMQHIPAEQFMDAWADSDNYIVVAASPGELEYEPSPLDLSGIELGSELDELREAIAENAHEVWAYNRKKEGWSYGPKRNDDLKQTPDMVPYSQLKDSEKQYDREMAINTIKLLKKLGYELIKK